jgi:hypothetical protein
MVSCLEMLSNPLTINMMRFEDEHTELDGTFERILALSACPKK